MKYKKLEAEHNGMKFKIEEDLPEVGVYLFVYKDDKCIIDDLQNDIETCQQIAFEDFQVPKEKWKLIDEIMG